MSWKPGLAQLPAGAGEGGLLGSLEGVFGADFDVDDGLAAAGGAGLDDTGSEAAEHAMAVRLSRTTTAYGQRMADPREMGGMGEMGEMGEGLGGDSDGQAVKRSRRRGSLLDL